MTPQTARRTSVLFVTPSLGGGGAEHQALRVANALDHSRFDVSVAVFRSGGAYERRLAPGITLEPLVPRPVADSSTLTALQASGALRRVVERTCPDVVVAFHTTAGIVAYRATRHRSNIALVVSVQNTLSHEASDSNPVTRLTANVAPFVLRRSDAVIALSHGVADDLSRSWGLDTSSITVVHNAGFDSRTKSMAEETVDLPSPRRTSTLVACGRLVEQKDYETLLRAFARVAPNHDCSLWILGDGPQRENLETLSVGLGVRDRVSFLGFLPNPFPYIKSADVFVLSSRYEGFANVVAEAMWLGVPVVSTDCEHGPREILGEDVTGGLLVPVGDAAALAGSIGALLSDQRHRESMGRAAANRASAFSDVASANGYADVIVSTLTSKALR